ncbi:hypothetical protein M9458_050764, partial [Cirrhinus mrigala]
LWMSWVWSVLLLRSPHAAAWMSGSCLASSRRPATRTNPTPGHSGRGLAGHPRSVRMDYGDNPHSQLPRRLAHSSPVRGGAVIQQITSSRPLGMPGTQGQFGQERTASQPTNLVSGSSFRLDPDEGNSCSRSSSGNTAARGLIQNQSLLSPQNVSKDARPYSFSIPSAKVRPASYAAPSVLAETTGSISCVAARTLAYQGGPGLCRSPDPLEDLALAGERYAPGYGLQEEGGHDRGLQHGLGSSVRWQTSFQPLEKSTGRDSHQLPRDAGSVSSPSVLLARSERTPRVAPSGGPSLEKPALVLGAVPAARSSPLAHSPETRPPLSGERDNMAPPAQTVGPAPLVSGWESMNLSESVLNTISLARVLSTRCLYALKCWSFFSAWCSTRGKDPASCDLSVKLSFLQELLDKGRSPSMLKVYVAAITASHAPIAGQSVGRNNLVVRFLKGSRRLNPPRPLAIPTWDLSTVLRALKGPPFEPLLGADLRLLTFKAALLLALASV